MLRFAFKPRHPVTRVAFTADGREVITAQPFTGIAVRDRLTGEARVTHALPRAPRITSIAVHRAGQWIGAITSTGDYLHGPRWGSQWHLVGRLGFLGYCTADGVPPLVSWLNYDSPSYWVWQFGENDEKPEIVGHKPMTTVRTTGRIHAVSPDGRFALCFRPQTRPILASLVRGEVVAELTAPIRLRHTSLDHPATFSPDGTKLVLGNGESLAVFDLSGVRIETPDGSKRAVLNPLFTLERPDPTVHGTFADKQAEQWLPPVTFDHAGRTMFTLGLRNRVQRIDLATGGVMAEWGWRCEPIRSLAVSPDNLTAAAGCQRGELVLWDLE